MTRLQNKKLPISALLVLYNNEAVVDRAFQSFADLVDDIVVIHDGPCSDASLTISRKYTDRIFIQERVGAAEPHRVFGYELCHHSWVLQIDADEFLSPELRTHLPHLISDSNRDGYEFLWPIWHKQKYYKGYYKRALVKKEKFYFIGAPDEYFKPINSQVRLKRLDYMLEHKPPADNITWGAFKRKWVPWTRLHAKYYTRPFAILKKYNCPPHITDWEPALKYRIQYPLLLGVIGSFLGHLYLGTMLFFKKRHWIFLKSGFLMALYNALVFYNVYKHKT